MRASDFVAFLKTFNEHLRDSCAADKNWAHLISPLALAHFERPEEEEAFIVFAEVKRQTNEGITMKSRNPLLALLVAEFAVKDGAEHVVFNNMMYYDNTRGVSPTEHNGGIPPFVPCRIWGFDPNTFGAAFIMSKILEAKAAGNVQAVRQLIPFLSEFLSWIGKKSPVRPFGNFVVPTNRAAVLCYILFAMHNVRTIAPVSGGLIEMHAAKLVSSDQMHELSRRAKETLGVLIPDVKSKRGKKPSKKRSRKERDADEGAAEEEDEEGAADIDFETTHDGRAGRPEAKTILERYLKDAQIVYNPEEMENAGEAQGDSKGRIGIKTLPHDPVMWYYTSYLPEDQLKKFQDDAVRTLVELFLSMFSNALFLSEFAGTPDDITIVWQPKAADKPLAEEDKKGLVKLLGVARLMARTHGSKSISFARLMCTDPKTLFRDVLSKLLESEAVHAKIFKFMNIYNQDLKDKYTEEDDMFSFMFTMLYMFLTTLVETANEAWKKTLLLTGHTVNSYVSYPIRKEFLILESKATNENRRVCDEVAKKLEVFKHRLSQRWSVVQLGSWPLLVALTYDTDKDDLSIRVKSMDGVPHPVVEGEDPITNHDLHFVVCTNPEDILMMLLNIVNKLADHFISVETPGDGLRMAGALKTNTVEFLVSFYYNTVMQAKYLRQLFEWGEGADELMEILEKSTLTNEYLCQETEDEIGETITMLLIKMGNTIYLKNKFSWVRTPALRGMVLFAIMPFFNVDVNKGTVKLEKIAAFTLEGVKLKANERFYHLSPDDKEIHAYEKVHDLGAHVKYDLWAGLGH